jgi:seryl-tRNA synthetase
MSILHRVFAGSFVLAGLCMLGCNQTTTPEDVRAARDEFEKQADEAIQAQDKAQEEVGKEVREAEQARQELERTQAKLAAEEARKAFVTAQRLQLEGFETKVDELKARANRYEGEAKQTLDDQIAVVEEKCDDARAKIDELEAAELDLWTAKRDDVALAMSQVGEELDKAERIR